MEDKFVVKNPQCSERGMYCRASMGRHPIHARRFEHGFPGGPGWPDPSYCEWAVVIGDRVRRLRRAQDMSLNDFALKVYRPDGGHYTAGYFSRLERGWGIRVVTPAASAMRVPGVRAVLRRAETWLAGSVLSYFGGFWVAVIRKGA